MRFPSALLRHAACAAVLATASLASAHSARAAGEVNIYSYREPGLINPLLETFTKETGIKTNVVFASNGLIERLAAEGKNSPADILLTQESGLLLQAVNAGVTQPMHSDTIDAAIPASLRDDKDQWFGLTRRARVVYASKDRVKQDAITYEELADPEVARQDLHSLRSAHVQRGSRRLDDRPPRRGIHREVAQRSQGQPGAPPRRRRP